MFTNHIFVDHNVTPTCICSRESDLAIFLDKTISSRISLLIQCVQFSLIGMVFESYGLSLHNFQ
uniref:Uncharacterized protein n=1 Tax=Triticum urartu TaxID=4572 RepID=A0A8R7UFF4_TRIUA